MLLKLGTTSPDVGTLETRLIALGLYTGATDNLYSASVESAVKTFQTAKGLTADGIVGNQTWASLFPPEPSPLAGAPIAQRCLALTGTFETSALAPACFAGLAGDFDGQGLSFGALQWNIGQGTLQPMFSEMASNHSDVLSTLFGQNLAAFNTMLASPRAQQLAWTRSIQDPTRHTVSDPWKSLFKALGLSAEFQAIQLAHAAVYQTAAVQLYQRFSLTTERAQALMFDICVQNGSIGAATEALIRADFVALDTELGKLQSIANRVAEASKAAYVEDVRTRKLTIANGTGTVHGVAYNLEQQFGIALRLAT
jgi:Putative peptidoglycan binding domain